MCECFCHVFASFVAEFAFRGDFNNFSANSVLDNLDMWGADSLVAIANRDTQLLRTKLARTQNVQPERFGILGGLQALAASATSQSVTSEEFPAGSPSKSKSYTYAQLSNLGLPFLRSGGAATFYGDVLSTLPGYRPTITPRGLALPFGKW